MKASLAGLLTPCLAFALAVAVASTAQACGYDRLGQRGSPSANRQHRSDSGPNTYMTREGWTHDENGVPYHNYNPYRDQYLRDLHRYNNLPWYQRWQQERPEYHPPESRPIGG
ncbi:MAG TPA: hypothetical protein VII63_05340 [Caulobacteraceae bacterium]